MMIARPAVGTLLTLTLGAPALFFFMLIFFGRPGDFTPGFPLVGILFLSAFLNLTFGRFMLILAIHDLGAVRAGQFAASSAATASMLGMMLLGEEPSVLILLGTLFIVGSLVCLIRFNLEQRTASRRTNATRGLLAGVMVSLSWGLGIVVAKIPLSELSAIVSAFYTLFLAMIMQGAYVAARTLNPAYRGQGLLPARRAIAYLLLSGLIGTFAFLAFVVALSLGSVALVAPLSTVSPVFSLILASIFIRKIEFINGGTVLSAIGVVIGAYLVTVG